MKKIITLLFLIVSFSTAFAQFSSIAYYNASINQNIPDTLRAWGGDQGIRTVWGGVDMDADGKQEILATDYSNGGRVHIFEKNGDVLELVFSTPVRHDPNASVPRWVRTGDLDGDGNMEFIFPRGERYSGVIEVWEYTGSDNDYGTTPAIFIKEDFFTAQGLDVLRLDREHGAVYDFDGDGRDELITSNKNNDLYVFGVTSSFPGFASFQVEAGIDANDQQLGKGSWWTSIPADIDGDGQKEVVSHQWNNLGFWSIKGTAADTYQYPDTNIAGLDPVYFEYLAADGVDGVAYMGVHAADVDGDNKDEIFGVIYAGSNDRSYQSFLVNPTDAHDGINGWDQAEFGAIADNTWELAGKSTGDHWGSAAYDFNGNGKDELLIGGSADYNLISMEYSGSGSLVDPASYNPEIVYEGAANIFHEVVIYDSAGVGVDTVYSEGPFVSKIYAGTDVNGDGEKELILGYQSVADSISYTRKVWSADSARYNVESEWKVFNPNAINIRVLEYDGVTGFKDLDLGVVTPDDYVLEQNFPNPFNPTTTINFTLPLDKNISLVVYDILGKEVKTLVDSQDMKKGSHQVTWDGTNNFNQKVASGNYIYTLKFGNFSKSAKMTLLK